MSVMMNVKLVNGRKKGNHLFTKVFYLNKREKQLLKNPGKK